MGRRSRVVYIKVGHADVAEAIHLAVQTELALAHGIGEAPDLSDLPTDPSASEPAPNLAARRPSTRAHLSSCARARALPGSRRTSRTRLY
jgi:hypothetical protein